MRIGLKDPHRIRKNYVTKQRTRQFFQWLCDELEMHQRHSRTSTLDYIRQKTKNKKKQTFGKIQMPLVALAHCAFNLKRVS